MNDLLTRNGMLAITAAAIVSACGQQQLAIDDSQPDEHVELLRHEHHESHGQSRRPSRCGRAVSEPGDRGRRRIENLARVPERRARPRQRQQPDERAHAYRHRTMGQRSRRRGGGKRQRPARAPRRRVGVRRRTRAADQRSVDRIAVACSARHPHGIVRRRLADGRAHLQRLDVVVVHRCRASGTFRRVRSQSGHVGLAVVVELGACERQLRRHRTTGRGGPRLLFCPIAAAPTISSTASPRMRVIVISFRA